jgi:mRNA interferase RelE/StbE
VANYELLIKRSAAKELAALPTSYRRRIATKIHLLAQDPRPPGVEKLSGAEWYRLRQGDYRVLYEIDDGNRTVTIVRIGHRRDVSRQ